MKLTFDEALHIAMKGIRVYRDGWKCTNKTVVYQKGYPEGIKCNAQTAKAWGIQEGDLFKCAPYLQIGDGEMHSMWVPSSGDLLAEDWKFECEPNNFKDIQVMVDMYRREKDFHRGLIGNGHTSFHKKGVYGFGVALTNLKEGKQVRRIFWNNKGYVVRRPYGFAININGEEMSWVPSITDIFAVDWIENSIGVVEEDRPVPPPVYKRKDETIRECINNIDETLKKFLDEYIKVARENTIRREWINSSKKDEEELINITNEPKKDWL